MHIDLMAENRTRILKAIGNSDMTPPFLVNLILAAVDPDQLVAIVKAMRTERPDLIERKVSPERRRLRMILG
jgi:hypothetical protein